MKGLRQLFALTLAVVLMTISVAGCADDDRPGSPTDLQTAPWRLAAPAAPATTTLSLLVLEIGCASGLPATGRIPPPVIDYRADSIVINVRIEPPTEAECPGNPETPLEVALREPVNGRALLDGGFAPPRVPPTTPLRTGPGLIDQLR